ncbi:MAG: replication protein [Armatimonadota bacterium]
MSGESAPFVPVPCAYIDEIMPWLTDTEWRVLVVVIRQTRGWKKERDWIARSQLAYRTGRSLDAVSRAVDGLARSGLILIEDGSGNLLRSPAERRRRSRDRLHYRLEPVTSHCVRQLIRNKT